MTLALELREMISLRNLCTCDASLEVLRTAETALLSVKFMFAAGVNLLSLSLILATGMSFNSNINHGQCCAVQNNLHIPIRTQHHSQS